MAQQDDIVKWGLIGGGLFLAYKTGLIDKLLSGFGVGGAVVGGGGTTGASGGGAEGGGTGGSGASAPVLRVALINTSRPGQPFRVGDDFRISISGAKPNAQFAVSATQDGRSLGTTPFGKTDSQGNYTQTGHLDAST